MRILLAIFFFLHGIAHLVGFVVPWRLMELEEVSYSTTLFFGRIDVGHTGIRLIGILWMLAAAGFLIVGIGLLKLLPWWTQFTRYAAVFSLVLSIAGLPESHIGVYINILIIAYLLLSGTFGWLPEM